ncbi:MULTISPECIES: hypothetical protein [Sandaracinus]|uniref:hypothetical protein n=1 Tax=Sandaracinus TaxID=1055688 RepID=UPI0019D4A906|nr:MULTISPECIES: hypothetical protein [Sandaracinus]QRN75827.1 Hypothetical protein MSR10575_89140 [Sandaracinus sp.]UJR87361.1 Hypothetical protein I5071_1530 [Sandaracinus amylolyticus]
MTRRSRSRSLLITIVVVMLSFFPALASAQSPEPLPARIDAVIELPGAGPPRFLNVSVDLGRGPWSIEGCVSSARGACSATAQIALDDADRRELVSRIQLAQARMRCPPPHSMPGDPTYTITTPSTSWEGALPRDPALVPSRLGTCAGANSLAWFLVERFGVPSLSAPQGGH